MTQIDDIKAQLADIKNSQADAASAAADLSDDVDQLLVLANNAGVPAEVVQAITDIQTTAKAQADALKTAAAKFPAPPTT